ncbi:MAG: sigma-70 family RNA polymerase sigma factor [Cytophagaceae bacterium]|nr:sigma-70 family RNA polymerase sigma factor [Cytophagaceae bacterium]
MKPTQVDTQQERILWQLFRAGNHTAYGELATMYYRNLYDYGRRYTKDHDLLKDAIQEVFLEFWRRRQALHETDSIKFYLFKSFRNRLFKEHRRLAWTTSADELPESGLDVEFSPETRIITQEVEEETQKRIRFIISQLPQRQQEAIYLRFFEDLDNEQIAQLLGINRQSVANLLHKALGQLKRNWFLLSETLSFLLLTLLP